MQNKPIFMMVLFSLVRHWLTIAGTYLIARGVIDSGTQSLLASDHAATVLVGAIMTGAAMLWSLLQKKQMLGWIRTALHLPNASSVEAVAKSAPGPDVAI